MPKSLLPETFLGLLPGWGGCYLLPRLIGAPNALKVIIENPLSQNKVLSGKDAVALGIGDVLLAPGDFLEDSLRWAAGVVSGAVSVERADHTGDEGAWNAACDAAAALVAVKTGGCATGAARAIELVRAARTSDRATAFAVEWKHTKDEDADAKSFLDAFFEVFGVQRRKVASFEKRPYRLPLIFRT